MIIKRSMRWKEYVEEEEWLEEEECVEEKEENEYN